MQFNIKLTVLEYVDLIGVMKKRTDIKIRLLCFIYDGKN